MALALSGGDVPGAAVPFHDQPVAPGGQCSPVIADPARAHGAGIGGGVRAPVAVSAFAPQERAAFAHNQCRAPFADMDMVQIAGRAQPLQRGRAILGVIADRQPAFAHDQRGAIHIQRHGLQREIAAHGAVHRAQIAAGCIQQQNFLIRADQQRARAVQPDNAAQIGLWRGHRLPVRAILQQDHATIAHDNRAPLGRQGDGVQISLGRQVQRGPRARPIARPAHAAAPDDQRYAVAMGRVIQRQRAQALLQFPPRSPARQDRTILDLVDVTRVMRGQQRRKQRHRDNQAQHAHADHGQPVLHHDPQGAHRGPKKRG